MFSIKRGKLQLASFTIKRAS